MVNSPLTVTEAELENLIHKDAEVHNCRIINFHKIYHKSNFYKAMFVGVKDNKISLFFMSFRYDPTSNRQLNTVERFIMPIEDINIVKNFIETINVDSVKVLYGKTEI